MATVSKKPPKTTPAPPPEPKQEHWILRGIDGIYRFLASLKLAVMLLTLLAFTLGYATFFESWYGTDAVQKYIYRSKGFALLLAMLGVNILCAALVRFPWKRRQTGFVVTHAGLITVLIGSFISLKTTDDGRVGLVEGDSGHQYVRIDHEVLRVQKVDPQTGQVDRQFVVPFSGGAFAWESQKLAAEAANPSFRLWTNVMRGALGLLALTLLAGLFWVAFRHPGWIGKPLGATLAMLATLLAIGLSYSAYTTRVGPRDEVLTDPSDPFRIVVKDYLPSSSELQTEYQAGEDGVPAVRVGLLTQPPGQKRAHDALAGQGWIPATSGELGHGTLEAGPARIEFQYLDGPHAAEALGHFLQPPAKPLEDRVAWFSYKDRSGQIRQHEWKLNDAKRGDSITLPESDLKVDFYGVTPWPTSREDLISLHERFDPRMLRLLAEMGRATDNGSVPAALFYVKKGDQEQVPHVGWAGLPMAPSVPPMLAEKEPDEPLVWIDYFHPPELGGGAMMQGTFGVIQVVATPDRKFYLRAFGRDGLRGTPGPIRRGEPVKVFGGDRMPMQVSLRLDEYLPSAVAKVICRPLDLPKEQREMARPAALVAMTVDDQTREFWLRRTRSLDPDFQTERFESGPWRISYDFDARELPFDVTLVDFNPSNDPGSSARAAFRSDVYLRELESGALDQKPFEDLADGQHFHFLDRPRETFRKTGSDRYVPFDGGQTLSLAAANTVVQPIPPPTKITMNYPMTHGHWTVYQTAFEPVRGRDFKPTGTYISILSVRYDPAWPVVYGGCLLVVFGTFLQFYMRAGVFTDGGKKERERLEARARRQEEKISSRSPEAESPSAAL